MSFDSSIALRRATGRAKSDVANKLVSMFLHEVSARMCDQAGAWVSDVAYRAAIMQAFGHSCVYCGQDLEHDRSAIEHLNGMNRFRAGLHIPGNVAVACRRCNSEKRRDDQKPELSLAESGWRSFLTHDGTRCAETCKTCAYWRGIWTDPSERSERLRATVSRIQTFRDPFASFDASYLSLLPLLKERAEALYYRSGQSFATTQIASLTTDLPVSISPAQDDRSTPS